MMMNSSLALSVIHCSGSDATDFLHNQLSQAVSDLNPQQARLFNYCSPRGRVLANGLVWKAADQATAAADNHNEHTTSDNHYYLLVHQSVAQSLLKRLQMFVLRAKVKLELLNSSVAASFSGNDSTANPLKATDWSLPISYGPKATHICIQAPGLDQAPLRFWHITLDAKADSAPSGLIEPQAWLAQELQTGWAWVTEATTDLFLPQNLNQDLLPAVNFSKGCFPGQEVVARSHYRATIRRRAVLVSSQAPELLSLDSFSLAGTDIVTLANEEPRIAGRVAMAAQVSGKLWALVETNLDFILNQEALYLAEQTETALKLETLPYQDDLPWEKKK